MDNLRNTLELIAQAQHFEVLEIATEDCKNFIVKVRFKKTFFFIPQTTPLIISDDIIHFSINNLKHFYNTVGVEKYYLKAKYINKK